MANSTNKTKEELTLEIFNLIENHPYNPDPSTLAKNCNIDEAMCLWELIEKDNILDDPRALDAVIRGRIRKCFCELLKDKPDIFKQQGKYTYLDELHYEVGEVNFSEAYQVHEIQKLLGTQLMDE